MPSAAFLRALRNLEKAIIAATGDASLARLVCQDIKQGRKTPSHVFRQAARKAARDRSTGARQQLRRLSQAASTQATRRQLRQLALSGAEETRQEVQTPLERTLPLIQRGIVGWAPDPINNNRATLVMRGNGRKVVDERGQPIVNPTRRFAYTYPKTVDIAAFTAHAVGAEGDIPWFYVDSARSVTVGRGHLVPNEAEARRLANNYAFIFEGSPARADAAAVMRAYKSVALTFDNSERSPDLLRPGFAGAYRGVSNVRLADHSLRALFGADVQQKIREIEARAEFSDYRTYPPEAKLAILDIAFKSGARGLAVGFPIFTAAVRFRDWQTAAQESRRGQVGVDRNTTVRRWLMRASLTEPFFLPAPSNRTKPVTLKELLR